MTVVQFRNRRRKYGWSKPATVISAAMIALILAAIAVAYREPLYAAISPACVIRANISKDTGDRIYHLPGQRYYDAARITPWRGERWFCSAEQAERAGWRRSRI